MVRGWARDGDVGAIEQFALVSMLPGLDPRRQLLVVAGLNSQVSDVAMEMLTDPARAAELTAALRSQAPNGPWYFQAVVRTEVRDRQPTRSTLVRLRLR